MHPVLKLVRAGNTVVTLAGTVVGGFAARGGGLVAPAELYLTLVLAGLSAACVTAAGNVLNDLRDRGSDRVNHPDRPLVTGAVTVGSARALCVGLFLASGALIVPIVFAAPGVVAILAVAIVVLLTYEFRWKSEGFAGNLLVAFLTAAVFLYGGAAVGRVVPDAPFAIMAFGATLSREVIKDMEDVKGDVDRRTLPQRRGFAFSSGVARTAVAAAIVLSPAPLLLYVAAGSAAGIIYLALVLLADAVFVASVAWLPGRLHLEQTLSKGAMTIALLAFLAVAFR